MSFPASGDRRGRRFVPGFLALGVSFVFGFLIVIACPAGEALAERLTPEEAAARLDSLRADIAARGLSFEIGPNSFSDLPWEEFQRRYLGLRLPEGFAPRPIINDRGVNDRDLPSYWDWREHHAVPGVRHQGACGSCWCFSAAGAFESAVMMAEGFEVDISEQHALVCNTGGSGCGGGWMSDAYDVWQSYGAIAEEDMRYEARDDLPCPGSAYPAIAKLSSTHDVGFSVSEIKNAIYYHGPVSATMMVYADLVPYENGCYYHSCPGELNHAIVLVGWDDSHCEGQGAWIMKNSWGEDWGIAGYAYIRYDAACIGDYASYVDYLPLADLLGINHTPLEDTEDTVGPYEIAAGIISTGGTVDLADSYVMYRINNGDWAQASFSPTGLPDEYHVFIAAQPAGTKVEYYLHAEDNVGQAKTVPIWAPENTYVFLVGTFEPILSDGFEGSPGWTAGAPGDDASTGIWELADPQGTYSDGYVVQPEDDHTPSPGTYCYVTDGRAGTGAGSYDVDGGKTTLLSPSFDLSEYELVVVDYFRWYTNRRGSSPYEDVWEVSVRSGTSTWVPLEYTTSCRENWNHQVHVLNDYVDLGSDVQIRFVASDEGSGSLVEAALDDFTLKGVRGETSAVPERERFAAPPLLITSPNPFRARADISFRLPRDGRAAVNVYDCTGRLLRVLCDREAAAGWNHLTWDGRDSAGKPAPSGVYFVRAASGALVSTSKLLITR